MNPDDSQSAASDSQNADLYQDLERWAAIRREELVAQLGPVLQVTAAYGSLVVRAVCALGTVPPKSRHDSVVRDLVADVFDFLYEWPRPLFEGRLHVAFPLARRAYESLSLLSVCYQDPALAKRWDSGKQIGNAEVRRALTKLQFSESEESLRDLYRFFSKGAHPNRDLVADRFLGEGNTLVLGSVGRPELVLVVDQCVRLVQMWFWFGALVAWLAKEELAAQDPGFGADYLAAAADAKEVADWLVESFNQLLPERQKEMAAEDHP